jgi:hypothetical protein
MCTCTCVHVVLCPRALPCLFVPNVPTYVSICMCYFGLKCFENSGLSRYRVHERVEESRDTEL